MARHSSSEREARRLAFSIAPGVLLAGVAGGIAFAVLPLVGLRAGLPMWFIGVILAANRAGRIVSSPLVGLLTDHAGGRRTLVAGLVLQVGVMTLYLLGIVLERPGLYFLLARLLHGPASACVFVAAQVLALHAGGREHGGIASGIVRAAMSAGMPVGLAVGGLLAALWGEEAMFEAAAVAVATGAVIAWLTVPDLRAPPRQGAGDTGGWRSLLKPRIAAVGLLNFTSFFAAQGIVLTTVGLLLEARGLQIGSLGSTGTAGLAMAWMVLISTATMIVTGRLGDRVRGHARIAAAGVALTVPGLLAVAGSNSLHAFLAAIGLVGFGMGALGPSVLALLCALIEPQERGRAAGAMQFFADVGGVLGPIVGTVLLARGQAVPYLIGAAAAMLALPVALWLVRLERREARAAPACAALDSSIE
jgi:MFS family permease